MGTEARAPVNLGLSYNQAMVDNDFLYSIDLFSELEDRQIELIQGLLKEGKYKKGELIIQEGIIGGALFIIVKGKVRIHLKFDDETIELAKLGPGDFVGEMSLIDDHAAAATVEADETTEVLILSREDFKSLLSNSTELSAKLWESLARNLNEKIRKTDELVKAYYGLNKALCQDPQFREFFTMCNFDRREKREE
jgi:CRP/FNR family transcriptional regulator, cyclic AMP receptor protein